MTNHQQTLDDAYFAERLADRWLLEKALVINLGDCTILAFQWEVHDELDA